MAEPRGVEEGSWRDEARTCGGGAAQLMLEARREVPSPPLSPSSVPLGPPVCRDSQEAAGKGVREIQISG